MKDFLGIFEKLNICFHLFVSDSADSSVPEGKLILFLKIRALILNFALLSFVDRLGIVHFLYWMKRKWL